jgi:uncharacterized protein (UPF0548 family)
LVIGVSDTVLLVPADLTYPEVGQTGGELPPGYRHIRRAAPIGRGAADFQRVSDQLFRWEMHRRAGLALVTADEQAELGADVLVGLRLGPLTFTAPCRIVRMVDEPRARGFAYGTLPGHPECGEEAFVVRLGDDDIVRMEITAFSKPARWFSRLGSPLARRVQSRITTRYLSALSSAGAGQP